MPKISNLNVPVLQNPRLYEALIERHGQRVLWYRGSKCWCMTDYGRPDPNCYNCDGRGDVYTPVTIVRKIDESVGQGNMTLTLSPKYNLSAVNRIYSVAGSWTVLGVNANRIVVDKVVEKARIVTVDFNEDLTTTFTGKAIAEGNGVLRVDISEEIEQGSFTGLIASISSLYNNTAPRTGNLTVLDTWENRILVSAASVQIGDDIDVTLVWTKAVKMVLSQIDPKVGYKNPTVQQEYHAQLITQGTFLIGEGDLITPQKMQARDSIIGIYKGSATEYRLPYFHVDRILRIEWSGGVIADATLVRKNIIKWGTTKPDSGAKFSVQLVYHPTFKVFQDIPNLRYAEDKVFPQKLFLKRFDAFNAQQDRPSLRVQPGD